MSIRISEPDEMELQFIGGGEARSPLWHTTILKSVENPFSESLGWCEKEEEEGRGEEGQAFRGTSEEV